MDARGLYENRRHGTPDFPVGVYRIDREAGETVLDNHWHAEAEFLALEKGTAVFQIGLATYEVHAGEALYIPGGELHGSYAAANAPCAYSALVFDLDWLAYGQDAAAIRWLQPLRRGEIAFPRHLSRSCPVGPEIYRIVTSLTAPERTDRAGWALRIKGGLYTAFAELADAGLNVTEKPETRTPGSLLQVLTYMEKHYDRRLTIKELAGIARMSEGHFSRLFKCYVRKTPIEYLNGLRLRLAAEKLREPGVSVAEAAISCGFDNFSYFSKLFRSRYRCTPSDYRKT